MRSHVYNNKELRLNDDSTELAVDKILKHRSVYELDPNRRENLVK